MRLRFIIPSHFARESSRPPLLLKYRSANWFVSLTVTVAIFTDLFLYAVVVPVIPYSISERVGVPQDEVQYWTSILLFAFGAALFAGSPFAGWLADSSFSRRVPFLCGLLLTGGATTMLCLGRSIGVLIAARVLQGLAGSVVWVVGLTLVVDAYGSSGVGAAMGTVSLGWTISLLVGPLLGGVVYEQAGYYAVFYMSFGLIFLDILLRLSLVEKRVARRWLENFNDDIESQNSTNVTQNPTIEEKDLEADNSTRAQSSQQIHSDKELEKELEVDIRQHPIFSNRSSTYTELEAATSSEQQQPHLSSSAHPTLTHPQPVLQSTSPPPAILPTTTTTATIPAPPSPPPSSSPPPRRTLFPFLPSFKTPPVLILLRSRRLLCAICAATVGSSILGAFDTVLPLHLRLIFDWNSTYSGLIFLALVVPSLLSPLVGAAVDRYGPRWISALGFALDAPLLVLLRFISDPNPEARTGQVVLLCVLLVLLGIASALVLMPTVSEFTLVVAAKERREPGVFGEKGAYAQAYGLFNMAYAAGTMIGPLWGGLVVDGAGWGTMVWSLAVLSAGMSVFSAGFTGGWVFRKDDGEEGRRGSGEVE